jgi:hypothetical protein
MGLQTSRTTIITLEPCALNVEFQHFIFRFNMPHIFGMPPPGRFIVHQKDELPFQNGSQEEEVEEKEATQELEFRKQKKKKTKEQKSREEGTRHTHTLHKGGETSGGGYLQEQ